MRRLGLLPPCSCRFRPCPRHTGTSYSCRSCLCSLLDAWAIRPGDRGDCACVVARCLRQGGGCTFPDGLCGWLALARRLCLRAVTGRCSSDYGFALPGWPLAAGLGASLQVAFQRGGTDLQLVGGEQFRDLFHRVATLTQPGDLAGQHLDAFLLRHHPLLVFDWWKCPQFLCDALHLLNSYCHVRSCLHYISFSIAFFFDASQCLKYCRCLCFPIIPIMGSALAVDFACVLFHTQHIPTNCSFCFRLETGLLPSRFVPCPNGVNRMADVEHIALRAMCPPSDAVSSTLRVSIRGSSLLPCRGPVTTM